MWDYTDKVKDHFLRPRNVGELEGANAIGETGSLNCGDALRLYLKVNENERIVDASFMTFGCASAVASSSALTEIIKGMTLTEAAKLTNEDISDYLGGLPREKMHCSVMGQSALKKAIANYRGIQILEKPGQVVCECFDVTDLEITDAVKKNGLATTEDVTNYLKAGGGCGKCLDRIEELIESVILKDRMIK
ncbi:MAG: Fe-S cluster assembly protein NifU [Desulfobacterales bacterium RIFOXYA12_FULL_46_15]|nr:MAG: Fe-S cluster assembly protein NifU [Desulfobacterales bacterium RIFOXYA12_FULL_46_15]